MSKKKQKTSRPKKIYISRSKKYHSIALSCWNKFITTKLIWMMRKLYNRYYKR